MTPLLLIGGGGHCHACIDVIETAGGYAITGVIQPKSAGQAPVLGYPVLGDEVVARPAPRDFQADELIEM